MSNSRLGALGGIVGEELDRYLVEMGQPVLREPEVAQDRTMVLCAFRTDPKAKQSPGMFAQSAKERITGDVILGPYATCRDERTLENMVNPRRFQAQRWVLNPVHTGDGKSRPEWTITVPPSIVTMHRVETTCPNPGCRDRVKREMKDSLIMRTQEFHGGTKSEKWSPETMDTPCAFCGVHPVGQRRLYNTALRFSQEIDEKTGKLKYGDDPVLIDEQMREDVLGPMLDAWLAGPPSDGKATFMLPRIWATYHKDRVPVAWTPTDAKARELVERSLRFKRVVKDNTNKIVRDADGKPVVEDYPLAVLPYDIAKGCHLPRAGRTISKALEHFIIDTPRLAVGWIPKGELYLTDSVGFKRRFWHDPLQRNMPVDDHDVEL